MHSTGLMGGVVLSSLEGFLAYTLSKGSSPPPCQLDPGRMGLSYPKFKTNGGLPHLQEEQSIPQGLD